MDIDKDRRMGRPPAEDPRINPPSIRIRESMVEKLREIAEATNKSQSDIWEEALDSYIRNYDQVKTFVVRL